DAVPVVPVRRRSSIHRRWWGARPHPPPPPPPPQSTFVTCRTCHGGDIDRSGGKRLPGVSILEAKLASSHLVAQAQCHRLAGPHHMPELDRKRLPDRDW